VSALRGALVECDRSYRTFFEQRREALVKERRQALSHVLDQGEQEATRALVDTIRTMYQPQTNVGKALSWLAERSLPVRIYEADGIEFRLPAATTSTETPALLEAAHKLLDSWTHFARGEQPNAQNPT
jgi:hypothetical protein